MPKILKIEIEVGSKLDVYRIVNELGFEFKVKNADFDGHREVFSKDNLPQHFMRDTSKIKASYPNKFHKPPKKKVNN